MSLQYTFKISAFVHNVLQAYVKNEVAFLLTFFFGFFFWSLLLGDELCKIRLHKVQIGNRK